MKMDGIPKITTEESLIKADSSSIILLQMQKNELLKLLSYEKEEAKREEIEKGIRVLNKNIQELSEEEKRNIIEREKARKEYEDNYVPNLSDLGFKEGVLNKPEKRQPADYQKMHQLVDKIQFDPFDPKEMIEGAVDDMGNIKNGSMLFEKLFYDKISLILGKQFADDCLVFSDEGDNVISWKEEEMQYKLSEFINDNYVNKKDIEKIVAIRFIGDIAYGIMLANEGYSSMDSFVSNSLITRFKNSNTSVLEKYYLKEVIYEIYNLERFSTHNIGNNFDNKERKDKLFLKKEIGVNFFPEKYYDKSFNKYEFEFNENQIEAIFHHQRHSFPEKIKQINYYKDSNIKIPAGHYWGEDGEEGYINSMLAPGVLGVYSKDGILLGWRNVIDLKEDEPNVINEIFEFKKEDQTILKEDLALFKVSSSLGFRDYIQKILGIDLSTVDIKNQFYFLNFIQGKTEKELIKFKRFINNSKNEEEKATKLKTFLSIEQGGKEMGDKILALGEKLPEDVSRKVFAKYGEIIDTVDNCEEEIKKIFKDKEVPARVLLSTKETLLKRGAKMLSDLGDKVLDPEFKVNETEILKELDEIKEETIILGKSYYELYWEGIRVPIEDITTIKETPTGNLTEEQKDKLLKIYEKGRPKVTYESKEHLDFLKKEFKEELNNNDISVNEVCFNNQTIIIALVDKKDKDNLYVGGLTFVDDVKNAVVAEATLSHLVEKFKDKNIRALVDSKNPLLKMYQKRFGFKIIKVLDSQEEIKNNGGAVYCEIERKKDLIIYEKQREKEAA